MSTSEPKPQLPLPPLPRAVGRLRMPPGVRATSGLTGFFLLGFLAFVASMVLAGEGRAAVMPFLGLAVIFGGASLVSLYLGLRGSRAGVVGGWALLVAIVVIAVRAVNQG